jgi:ketosteroid isomerase-like protein
MTPPVEIVRRHLLALSQSDIQALSTTVTASVQLRLEGVEDWDWTLTSLYRAVTQAWNFIPGDIRLDDLGSGHLAATLHLTNGDATKIVEGDYRVSGDRIDAITLRDASRSRL